MSLADIWRSGGAGASQVGSWTSGRAEPQRRLEPGLTEASPPGLPLQQEQTMTSPPRSPLEQELEEKIPPLGPHLGNKDRRMSIPHWDLLWNSCKRRRNPFLGPLGNR